MINHEKFHIFTTFKLRFLISSYFHSFYIAIFDLITFSRLLNWDFWYFCSSSLLPLLCCCCEHKSHEMTVLNHFGLNYTTISKQKGLTEPKRSNIKLYCRVILVRDLNNSSDCWIFQILKIQLLARMYYHPKWENRLQLWNS